MICYIGLMKFLGLALALINLMRISNAEDADLLHKVIIVPGNFTIAALFSVHQLTSNLYYPKCGPIQDQAGMQRVEAALWEVKRINEENERKNLTYTFGLEIRDTCGSYTYAFQQGLSIRNTVLVSKNSTIVGTIGPASSEEVRISHEWIGKYMPQVSFSATSPRMTDKKEEFNNFARLVPPDNYQAQVILDLVTYFGQSYVNTIISAGIYGMDALKEFEKTTENSKICIGSKESVFDDTTDKEIEKIIRNSTEFSGMVVCFCDGRTLSKLYRVAGKLDLGKQVLFINSDGWTETDNLTDFQKYNFDSIMINPSPELKIEDDFSEHYKNIVFWDPSENPWIEEFLQHRFNCSLNQSSDSHRCTGDEIHDKNFVQDPKLPLIRYSIRAIAEATNHYVESKCQNNQTFCNKTLTTEDLTDLGPYFMNYTRKNPIKYGNNSLFHFDDKGDPKTSTYEILSYTSTKKEDGNFTFHVIGSWNSNDRLKMNESWRSMFEKYKHMKNKCKNECKNECKPGQYRNRCCCTCIDCSNTSVSDGSLENECKECEGCLTPNKDKSECIEKENNLKVHDIQGSVTVFISLLGAVLTSFTAYTFCKYRRTPIVKFCSFPLSFIIFCGMGLAHSSTLFNVQEPTFFTCTILRFIPSISLTMIYGPILMKTNRISRALSATKKRYPPSRMKYLSAAFLVSVSFLFVLVDIIVCAVQYMLVTAEGDRIISNCSGPIKIVFCPAESIAEFNIRHTVNVFLLAYCALYAYRNGLHLPDNFNETKFVMLSCGATAIVWAAFLVAFVFLQRQEDWTTRALFLSMSLSLSALISLVCMYFTKLYVILYRPKQNHRAFYSTVTEMRYYFGHTESVCRGFSSVDMDSTVDDHTMTTVQNTKKRNKTLKLKGNRNVEEEI